MVQLRKSRKSFRKTRGRKTRQRKNEKRKSRKTRSTRKTGGGGEETIADKIKELASKIGELIKITSELRVAKAFGPVNVEEVQAIEVSKAIQEIFNWLIKWKLVRCYFNSEYATCQRKKMIYYYIAVHLYLLFKVFINLTDSYKPYEQLISKFENHKTKYDNYTVQAGSGGGEVLAQWLKEEEKYIFGVVETLYNSIGIIKDYQESQEKVKNKIKTQLYEEKEVGLKKAGFKFPQITRSNLLNIKQLCIFDVLTEKHTQTFKENGWVNTLKDQRFEK